MASPIAHLLSKRHNASRISLLLVASAWAEQLAFTDYPRSVQYGETYDIKWRTEDSAALVTLAVVRGDGKDVSMIVLTATSALQSLYQWTPTSSIEAGDDYHLMIAQDDDVIHSSNISIGQITSSVPAVSTRASSSHQIAESRVPPPLTATAITPGFPSATVKIINPTPTSSWDAPREEDSTLTTDDKVAIGIGIPIALLVLGTIGWWRAAKFFVHRRITGELRLPIYEASKSSAPTVAIGSAMMRVGCRQGSRAPSLWDASSGWNGRSREPSPPRINEQVVIIPPSPVAGPAGPST